MTKENKNKHHHHNQHHDEKKKRKQRITMVRSWFYTGYRKKNPNSWIEQKKRIHSDEKKKRESYCAHIKQ
jgi:hypothetical protein